MKKYKTGEWVVVLDTPSVRGWSQGGQAVGKVLQIDSCNSSSYYLCGKNIYGINYKEEDLRPALPHEIPTPPTRVLTTSEVNIGGYVKFTKESIYPGSCPPGTYGRIEEIGGGHLRVISLSSGSKMLWNFLMPTRGLEWVGMELPGESAPKVPTIDLSNTKIWIGKNPGLSRRVQEKAFELGWGWSARGGDKTAQYTGEVSLRFYHDKSICYSSHDTTAGVKTSSFIADSKKEIFPSDLGIYEETSSKAEEERIYHEGWYQISGPDVEVVYAYLTGVRKSKAELRIKERVFLDGIREVIDSYILEILVGPSCSKESVDMFVDAKKPIKTKFLKDEYIVSLVSAANSAPTNWCVKQREDREDIAPYVDSKGKTSNSNSALLAKNDIHWRYATPEEIRIYEAYGPFDITNPPSEKIHIESPKTEKKMEEMPLIKPGDIVTLAKTPTREDWGKMGVAPEFPGTKTVNQVKENHNDGIYYAQMAENSYWYPISCLAVIEDRTISTKTAEKTCKFNLGDIVEGTCVSGSPYGTTCRGWRGKVIRLYDSGEIRVKAIMGALDEFDVDPKYFKLHSPDPGISTESYKFAFSSRPNYSVGEMVTLIDNKAVSRNRIGETGRIEEKSSTSDSVSVVTKSGWKSSVWSKPEDIRYATPEEIEAYEKGFVSLKDYLAALKIKGQETPTTGNISSKTEDCYVTKENAYEGLKVKKAPFWEWGSQGAGCEYGVIHRINESAWADVAWIDKDGNRQGICSYRIAGDKLDLLVYNSSYSLSGIGSVKLVSISDDIKTIPLRDETSSMRLVKID